MTEGAPIACSLDQSGLQHRLREIAKVGANGLTDYDTDEDRHLLFFRSSKETRKRLAAIVAAEAKCCSFLDLSLEDRDDVLVLSIRAPEDGRPIADGLAAAFTEHLRAPRR
jgi:hypothetical protein